MQDGYKMGVRGGEQIPGQKASLTNGVLNLFAAAGIPPGPIYKLGH